MLKFMNKASPRLQGSIAVQRFIDRVNADFRKVKDPPAGRDYLPGEEIFFWCLSQLEELAEVPHAMDPPDPSIAMMLDTFPDLARRLKSREAAPAGMNIHWLGDEDLDDELDLACGDGFPEPESPLEAGRLVH
jgi:hypothetical protein